MTDEFLSDASLLIVDDDVLVRDFFIETLSRRNIKAVACSNGAEAQKVLDSTYIDIVISDVRMPNVDGKELLRWIKGYYPLIPVIMLTAYGTVENAVDAMRTGAFDYLCKPITDLSQLDLVLMRAMNYRQILSENQQLRSELSGKYRFTQLIGQSLQMQQIFSLLETVAPTQATVLIQGASGTGKELVACAIHYNSPRSKAPFIKINCAALPEGLIESELFGHEKGAFTGAFKTTRGKFEAANSGTLMLDEIGEMPLGLQSKLLRVLQEQEFQRVGSTETVAVDVRLIATTNINLKKAVAAGEFREDLFYRLNVIPIHLPLLKDRCDDIQVLSYHFLRRYSSLHGRKIDRISHDAIKFLMYAPWPGNVRELENSIERAVVMCRGDEILLSDFFVFQETPAQPEKYLKDSVSINPGDPITLAELEKKHIIASLRTQNNHRAQTAELLGISIRTLRNKLNEYRRNGEDV